MTVAWRLPRWKYFNGVITGRVADRSKVTECVELPRKRLGCLSLLEADILAMAKIGALPRRQYGADDDKGGTAFLKDAG